MKPAGAPGPAHSECCFLAELSATVTPLRIPESVDDVVSRVELFHLGDGKPSALTAVPPPLLHLNMIIIEWKE